MTAFQDEVMMPMHEGGPRTADEENRFENLIFGVDDDRTLIKYGNPRLMGYLFPTLYVNGEGFYSLDYDRIMDPSASVIDVHEVEDHDVLRTGSRNGDIPLQLDVDGGESDDDSDDDSRYASDDDDSFDDSDDGANSESDDDAMNDRANGVMINGRKTAARDQLYCTRFNRFIYQCGEEDSQIVGYNMHLLRFGRVNMDLQYNHGSQAKSDAYVKNFHYRSVSVTEAIMDLCGWKALVPYSCY
ncbi:hypothetical protein BGZ83_010426 [Gryganskiella cystojenkinii]|nr:hypothetical protein BGZ83_010426 [Gryganskiella cystojenkinii]